MSTGFRGLLQSQHKPPTALRISLVLSEDEVEIHSELGFVGRWPVDDMAVEPAQDGWFELTLGEDRWDFRPDDPNGFLLAAPLPKAGAGPKRPPARPRRLSRLGQNAIGAVLAVLLLSIGIVIGRYQLDGTGLRLTSMLILAAALGAGWASMKTSESTAPERRGRPAPALKTSGRRAPLRVEDVIRNADRRPGTDSPQTPEPRPDGSVRPTEGPTTPADADAPDTDSSDEPEPVASPSSDRLADSPQGRPEDEFEAVGPAESDTALESEEGSDAQPAWVSIAWEEGQDVIDLDTLDTGSPDVSDDEAPPSEGEDASILPTEAIKRYLASLSNLEEHALEPNGDVGAAHEAVDEDDDTAHESDGPGFALTDIRGIGPALSTALGQLGVADVHDLAQLESDDLDYLQEQLGRFGPRIRSERWVEQARQMIRDE